MTLLEALPKREGMILLEPGAEVNGGAIAGLVDPAWFEEHFPSLAGASVPLSDTQYEQLRSIDRFWQQNAERWRAEGRI